MPRKDDYWFLVEHGLCVRCKGEEGTPHAGERTCSYCKAKYYRIRTPEERRANAKKRARARRAFVAAGCCGQCGEKVTDINPATGKKFVQCMDCQLAQYQRTREARGHVGINRCSRCGEAGHAKTRCKRVRRARLDAPMPPAPICVDEYALARREA